MYLFYSCLCLLVRNSVSFPLERSMQFFFFSCLFASYCVTIPLRPLECINFFETFQTWPLNHLVVPIGVSHISLRHKKYNQRSGRKRTKNKRTIRVWVNSSARRLSCDTLHSLWICRLTLACISSKISTKLRRMPTHPDWPSLTASGPILMPTGLPCCPFSTANCHSVSPYANCLLWVPSSNSWLAFPCLLPSHRDLELRLLFGFALKQTKWSSA